MNHDPKTGKFLPGNQAAAGNKGNRNPKHGNQNAIKHGLYRTIFRTMSVDKNGCLRIWQIGAGEVVLDPDAFIECTEQRAQTYAIRRDVVEELRALNFRI